MSDQEYIEALNHTQGIVVKHIAHLDERIAQLEAENAKLRDAARAVVDDANIEPDTGWELPSYCHVERSEILALAALQEPTRYE